MLTDEQKKVLYADPGFKKITTGYNTTYSPATISVDEKIKLRQEKAKSLMSGKIETPIKENGFISGVKGDIQKRAENLGNIADRYGAKEQGLASSAFQTAGQAAGAVGDILFQGAKAITPNFIKKPIKETITNIASTRPAQDIASAYSSWAEKHPEASANLEATVNIASLFPAGKGASLGSEVVGKIAGKTAGVLEASAEKGLLAEKSNFINKLVKPVETKAVKESQVARTSETGSGIFKKSVIEPTIQEKNMAEAVSSVPNLNTKGTFQENYNIISDHNTNLAKQLEADLASNDFVISKKEVLSRLNSAKESLANSPLIVGDAEITANRLLAGAKDIISKNKGTGSGLLKSRKEYDIWVKSQKPKAFDAKAENAFTIANREIRDTFNNILESKAPDLGIKSRLSSQSNLYRAMETIAPKAAEEANTAIGRSLQKIGSILGTKNKAVQAAAAVIGIGGLGAASTFAPVVAAIGVPSYLIYQAGKLVLSPQAKKVFANLLREIESKSRLINNPIEVKALEEAKVQIKAAIDNHEGFARLPSFNTPAVGKTVDPLIEEAKKYKSAEEFINSQNKKDYRSAHQLSLSDSTTADKINIPDLKEKIRARNGYLNNYNLADLKKLEKLKNNPEAEITIYRASPKNELNDGDWVTTDKTYANDIKKQNGGKVYSYTAKVKDLRFPKDTETLPSLSMASTFNYSPKTAQLTDIWNKANK